MSVMYKSLMSCSALRSAALGRGLLSGQSRSVVLRSQPAVAKTATSEDYWDKNKRLNRPMSPHLTIYRPQVTSMLSITHRITGLATSGYIYAFSIGMMALPGTFPYYCATLAQTSPALVVAAKFLLAFPFAYHTCNGLRHLMWDLGKGLEINQVYKTGYIMVGSAILLTLGLLSL